METFLSATISQRQRERNRQKLIYSQLIEPFITQELDDDAGKGKNIETPNNLPLKFCQATLQRYMFGPSLPHPQTTSSSKTNDGHTHLMGGRGDCALIINV